MKQNRVPFGLTVITDRSDWPVVSRNKDRMVKLFLRKRAEVRIAGHHNKEMNMDLNSAEHVDYMPVVTDESQLPDPF